MYEEMTYENLMQQALANVSDKFDKRQGSIIYDAIAPICAVIAQSYVDLELVLKQGFADSSSREYLVKRARERGIYPYEATYSIILAEMTGDFSLDGGERFNCEDLNFFYTGEMDGEYFKLQCETSGSLGNITYGSLLPIDNIAGLETAEVLGVFSAGRDEEDTEDFRQRYFKTFESQSFGGNRADYESKLLSLNENSEISINGGIGGIKIYRTPNGGGTVSIVITNNFYKSPTEELISLVQDEIDPEISSGDGYGIAPIGHSVTILPVGETKLSFSTNITLKSGFSLEDVQEFIENAIEKYLQELRESWEYEEIIVRISRIESAILEINGVLDIGDTMINGNSKNLEIDECNIPVKESIYVNVN